MGKIKKAWKNRWLEIVLTSVSLSKSMISMLSVSSGIVPRTKVTVEMTTTDIEVKAKI